MKASAASTLALAVGLLCTVQASAQKNVTSVKPGECPRRKSWCDRPPPYNHMCNNDADCRGTQKCCIQVCTQECKDIVPVELKPGMCPADTVRCINPEVDLCKIDRDCSGDLKCCHFHCGLKCRNTTAAAAPEKNGSCPLPPSYLKCNNFPNPPKNQCATDQQCPKDEKCCHYDCSLQCKKPLQDKSGHCPFFDMSICITAKSVDYCRNDTQCPGTERCCRYGNCRMECTRTVTLKTGTCPQPPADCGYHLPAQRCEDDGDCTGRKKCCAHCGVQCMDPAEKPGFCPVDPGLVEQCSYCPPPRCTNDRDCRPDEKCCLFGCGVQCVKALQVKPGMCPAILAKCTATPDKPQCQHDGDCLANKKCCQMCGNKCLDAVPDRPGICPSYDLKPMVCPAIYTPSCDHDWNCKENKKCCNSGCRRECVKPLKVKMGECPKIPSYHKPQETCNKCNTDKDCPEKYRCCPGAHGLQCLQPSGNPALPHHK